jgi:long-chain acyl-CoA synthetase
MNVVDKIRHFARERPDHAAIIHGDSGATATITYAELLERVDQVAKGLVRSGVQPGQRIGVTAPQSPEFIETALAVISTGACLVPIPSGTAGKSLDTFSRQSYLHAVVTTADSPEAKPTVASLPQNTQLDRDVEAAFTTLAPAYLRFTSGTTNTRKGVVIGHDAIAHRLESANSVLAIGAEDRVLWLLPMAHHFVVSILLYLREGATVLLPGNALAAAILDFAHDANASVIYASPYHLRLLSGDRSDRTLERLRLAVSTAEQLRHETARAFLDRFGLAPVQALGIIEVGLPVVNLAAAADKPEALGRPVGAYDVWLRDENGKRMQASSARQTGEICIGGPGLFDAYLDPWTPSNTASGGFRTGDQGWFDEDGDLHLAGRRVNRINMAGMKFFCEEVERVVDLHPGVECSLVYAREHPRLGEIPVADVVIKPGSDPSLAKTLAKHCRDHLAAYMIPREFRVVEELPQTATGKVSRIRRAKE